jgi:hypothetical protein
MLRLNRLAATSRGTEPALAIGRVYGDVMPLRGVINTGGDHTLTVALTRCADPGRIHRLPPRTDP